MTWHWRITQIPSTATNFGVYESHYDINGYTRITKINGNVVEKPGTPQNVTVLKPGVTMTNITDDYTTTDSNKVFTNYTPLSLFFNGKLYFIKVYTVKG